jgi:hypothetical protein
MRADIGCGVVADEEWKEERKVLRRDWNQEIGRAVRQEGLRDFRKRKWVDRVR